MSHVGRSVGRPQSPVWKEFEAVGSQQDKKMRCTHCMALVSRRPARMAKHFETCPRRPGPSRPKKAKISAAESGESSDPDDVTEVPHEAVKPRKAAPESGKSMPMRQQKMTTWTVRTTGAEKENIDNAVAEFFYGCNIPFSVVEHPLFTTLIAKLRPGYQAPNRKMLAGSMLDRCNDGLKEAIKDELKDVDKATLVQDGWSNIHNEPVVAHSICSNGKSYLGHSSTDRPGVNIVMSAISIKIATIGESWALITNIKSVFEYILPFKSYSLRQF